MQPTLPHDGSSSFDELVPGYTIWRDPFPSQYRKQWRWARQSAANSVYVFHVSNHGGADSFEEAVVAAERHKSAVTAKVTHANR